EKRRAHRLSTRKELRLTVGRADGRRDDGYAVVPPIHRDLATQDAPILRRRLEGEDAAASQSARKGEEADVRPHVKNDRAHGEAAHDGLVDVRFVAALLITRAIAVDGAQSIAIDRCDIATPPREELDRGVERALPKPRKKTHGDALRRVVDDE